MPADGVRANCVSDEHMEACERILLRTLDEDDAMSVMTDLQADGYYLVHLPSLNLELDRMEAIARSGDHFERVLREVLAHFTEHGHPGRSCVRTPWLNTETVERWRAVVSSPSSRDEVRAPETVADGAASDGES